MRLVCVLLALSAAACGQDMTVTVRMGDRPPDPVEAAPTARSPALLAAGITVDRFLIVLRDIRLESYLTTAGESTPAEAVIGPGPVLFDGSGDRLAPGAMTEVVPARHVAWKSYYEVDLNLGPVTQAEVDANPALAPLLGSSFVIEGRTPSGASYTFRSALQTVLVRPATFRNGLNHNNVTINIAPNAWFSGANGLGLDPTSPDPAVHAEIEGNVAASIDGYMDDDRNGEPDPLG